MAHIRTLYPTLLNIFIPFNLKLIILQAGVLPKI